MAAREVVLKLATPASVIRHDGVDYTVKAGPVSKVVDTTAAGDSFSAAYLAARLRGMVVPLTALIGLTAVSGAFVAGLDAGHAYNTFPLMDGGLYPADEILRLRPLWKNFFENTATVQFDHRVLAASTLCSVGAVWALSRGLPVPARSAMLLNALMAVTCVQVSLGVATLLNHVPVALGSAHQAGALTLFSVAVSLLHSLRR